MSVEPARTLSQAGIAGADLETAADATKRCRQITGWSVEDAAEFVATAAAIGGITGPSLLLLPNLAHIVARAEGRR